MGTLHSEQNVFIVDPQLDMNGPLTLNTRCPGSSASSPLDPRAAGNDYHRFRVQTMAGLEHLKTTQAATMGGFLPRAGMAFHAYSCPSSRNVAQALGHEAVRDLNR
jgi:hypothetical protein